MEPEKLEYCAGMALDSARPFTDQERADLQGSLRRTQILIALSLAWLPLVILSLYGASALSGDSPILPKIIDVAGMGMGVAIPMWLILPWFPVHSAVRARRELRANQVKTFRGSPDDLEIDDAAQKSLIAKGLLAPGAPGQYVEIIPPTGRVLSVCGRAPHPQMWVEIRSLAAAPPRVHAASPRPGEPAPVGGERRLTGAELEELRAHARRAWTPYRWVAPLLSMWFFPILIAGLIQGEPLPQGAGNATLFIWLGLMALFFDVSLIRGVWTGRLLMRDVRSGSVLIVNLTTLRRGKALTTEHSDPIERLPYSGKVWTISGGPAPWRKAVSS